MFKRTILIVLCIAFFLISTTLLAINIRQEKVINKQTEIIAMQTDYQYELEETINTQNQIIEDQEIVMNVYEDIIDLHNLMREVKEE